MNRRHICHHTVPSTWYHLPSISSMHKPTHLVAGEQIVDQVVARRHPPRQNLVEVFVLFRADPKLGREHAAGLFAEFLVEGDR